MNREILKSVLADYRMEIPRHILVPRHFEFEDFGNYVLVGIRRAGKSYLLYQRIQQLLNSGIGWDEILYLNFEDELAIQVSYSLDDIETLNRETNALIKLSSILSCKKLMIITRDEERTVEIKGKTIEIIPIWKWSLD